MSDSTVPKRGRIAVVGTGVAGLTCAYLLSQEYEVTVFESAETLGMDSASKTFAGARMDVPLRTFSADYYPNLTALYERLGVEFSHANYEFACFKDRETTPYFSYVNIFRSSILKRLSGYDVVSLPRISWLNPISIVRYFSLLSEYYFFQKRGPFDLKQGKCAGLTFKEYILQHHSERFYTELLLPMLSVICTCSWTAVGDYPAEIIVDYMAGRSREHPLGSTTLRAVSGTTETVRRLSASFDRVFTSSRVLKVVAGGRDKSSLKPRVSWSQKGSNAISEEEFDQVVVATQANAAMGMLQEEGAERQRSALSRIKYEKSRTLLHTDESMLPSISTAATCTLSVTPSASDCTIWMNRIDSLLGSALQKNVFQTWNPLKEPKPDTSVVDVIFDRPVMTLDSQDALDKLAEVNGKDGLWFVGAYSLYSMPLLENGARSAIRVANRLLNKKYPELGVQISGEAFAKRRPDLVMSESAHGVLLRKRSKAAIVVDTFVVSSYLALFLGAASLVALPLARVMRSA